MSEKTPVVADFFSDNPPARIIGTESECNIQESKPHSVVEYVSSESINAIGIKNAHGFLDNGMRIYVDVGHIEIAKAESFGAIEAAASDIA